ncbi:hypothetical protein [Pseudidiomarina terrestris]|uniref:Carboxyl-terminal protease n=1 Tax=Pseudidiomarina terrestris TaxID=2820060 RepID=A0AAW7QXR0_9GAMM|nr:MULTISPECIES: hypothetical protein [unclassified Pseudidiomarina]MDN7124957.1 hypothetical protein [Pseudidiomarina sp. 1APP75-32.1]MDN7126032.1 hypothetical protein [Pseudidiomarina sp. 1APR75-33.1]MDN7129568.1 hypothetical protein [Pseudidiomarina sp. 1APR75-15]MDN7135883.1 hypothetical protein [Pseudidiomarina sp. 1ASP75-5]MEA3588048.1 hypothetical protein [Pseudidiomarina sp. 1APP75-27a]
MNQSKKGYRMRSWLFGFVASVIGLLTGVWMGVGMAPNSLLASEGGFLQVLRIVDNSLAEDDIPEAKRRLELFYLSNRDGQLDDLYQNEFFLNEPQKKEWDFVLEKRVKEIEE